MALGFGDVEHGFLEGPRRTGARASGQDVPEALADILVRAGRKGQKTGGGWYDYRSGERSPQPSQTVTSLLAASICDTSVLAAEKIATCLVAAMAAEGRAILAEGIALSASDIDLVEVHGYGFPRWRGGPMFATR